MEIVNRNDVNSFITKDKSEIREILAPANSSLRYQSLAEAIVNPGDITEEHYHLRAEEIYYVLEGRGRIWIEGEPCEVKVGDGIVLLPGKKHKIKNTGTQPLVFLCCCSPAYTHDDTVLV